MKSGRGRLTLVTALTVASLLIGASALSALAAEGRGSGGGNAHDGGQVVHAQTAPAADAGNANHGGSSGNAHADTPQHAAPAGNDTMHTNSSASVSNDNGQNGQSHADQNDGHGNTSDDTSVATPTPDTTTVSSDDQNNEDLVTPPGRVTGEQRPGLGCGDPNHIHTGPPGNPGKTPANSCPPKFTSGDDSSGG